ncbi:MAG TPA: hypothetical protein VJJ80_03520 [Patescibacteria group bacterium]|nr:hypothetical protein [Patescibacteria group bacterium]
MQKRSKFLSIMVVILTIFWLWQTTLAADTQSLNMNVKVIDVLPPANVSNLTTSAGDRHITLTWVNPTDADFKGVKIQRRTNYYPVDPNDGDNVYNGKETLFVDQNLTNDIRYYYTAFVYDYTGNFASGAVTSAVPTAPTLTLLEEEGRLLLPTTPQTNIKAPVKKEKIETIDFNFYIVFDKGPLKIDLNNLQQLKAVKESKLMITVRDDIFPKEVNVIAVTIAGSSYLMQRVPDQHLYRTIFTMPTQKGIYDITVIIIYKDGTTQDVKIKTVVDPFGYVYQEKSFFGFGEKQEVRINGAQITLYYSKGNKWHEWNAEEFNQQNPITTDKTGEYYFFVPNGKYYMKVTKSGYLSYQTTPFEVKDQVLNKNIKLVPIFRAWFLLILALIVLLGIILIIVIKKRKRRLQKPKNLDIIS